MQISVALQQTNMHYIQYGCPAVSFISAVIIKMPGDLTSVCMCERSNWTTVSTNDDICHKCGGLSQHRWCFHI